MPRKAAPEEIGTCGIHHMQPWRRAYNFSVKIEACVKASETFTRDRRTPRC